MARILGLDYGGKTVGVAVSDLLGLTASSLTIIRRERENKLRKTLAEIQNLIDEYEVSVIVLGFPMHLDGTAGVRCEKTLAFKEMLENKTGLPVVLRDERLTTVEADEIMDLQGIEKKDRKKYVDQIAAAVILQGYLDDARLEQENRVK